MYINANNTKKADLSDYALKAHVPQNVVDLRDGHNYYTIDEVHDLIKKLENGEIPLGQYVLYTELVRYLQSHVTDVEIEYYLSDSTTELVGGEWNIIPEEWVNGKYMWQRMIISYPGVNDMAQQVYIPDENGICIAGAQGDTGEKGQSLIEMKPQWCLSGDEFTPGSDWQYEMPEIDEYSFMWLRYELVWQYPDDTTYTEPVLDQIMEKVKTNKSNIDLLNTLLDEFKTEVQNTYQTIEDMENYVSKDFLTETMDAFREELAEIYITKEDYQEQTTAAIEDLQEKLTAGGGVNLIKNGDFYNNFDGWAKMENGSIDFQLQEQIDYPSGKACIIQGERGVGIKSIQQNITPATRVMDTKYTMSCMMYVSSGNDFGEAIYRMYAEVYYDDDSIEKIEVPIEEFNKWVKLEYTFTAKTNINYIEFHIELGNCDRLLKVTEIMFEYGEIANHFAVSINEVRNSIPRNISELDNNLGFMTKTQVDNMIAALQEQIADLQQQIDELKNN